jgi:hypothetical protein
VPVRFEVERVEKCAPPVRHHTVGRWRSKSPTGPRVRRTGSESCMALTLNSRAPGR